MTNNNTDKMRAEFEKLPSGQKYDRAKSFLKDWAKHEKNPAEKAAIIIRELLEDIAALNLNPPAGHEVGEDVVESIKNALIERYIQFPMNTKMEARWKPLAKAAIAAMPNKEAALREGWLKIKEKPPMRERNYLVLSITHGLQVGYWSDKGFAGTNWCFDVPNVESYHEIPPLSGEQKTVTEEGK